MSEEEALPQLVLKPEQVLCPRHMEPFREHWPEGYPTFMLKAMVELGVVLAPGETKVKPGGLMDQVPRAPDGSLLPLNQALGWVDLQLGDKPMCCRLSKETLLRLLSGARAWGRKRCRNCGKVAPGGPYKSAVPDGGVVQLSHVCLRCVVRRSHSRETK